jgi:hypothetical protein
VGAVRGRAAASRIIREMEKWGWSLFAFTQKVKKHKVLLSEATFGVIRLIFSSIE